MFKEKVFNFGSKDPGPEGPALVHPSGVICVITFTTVFSVQVSAPPLAAGEARLIEKETSALLCLRGEVSGVGCQVSGGAKLNIGY
jgi:hypothetical protein